MKEKTPSNLSINSVFYQEKKSVIKFKESSHLQGLSKSLCQGDHSAWEEIYKKLYDPLTLFVYRILRSREDASDIAQETFIYLWQNLNKIDPEKSIKGYIYIIAKGLAHKCLRERAKADGSTSLSELPEPSVEDVSPDDIVMANEMKILIALALETMPRQRRQIFEMSRYEGLTNDEIAAKMKLSKRTVEIHIYRVTKELRDLLYLAALFLPINGVVSLLD